MFKSENEFLTALLGKPVKVFLINGIKLVGTLEQVFDSGDLIICEQNAMQLVRKNAQSSVLPRQKEQY